MAAVKRRLAIGRVDPHAIRGEAGGDRVDAFGEPADPVLTGEHESASASSRAAPQPEAVARSVVLGEPRDPARREA